MNKVSRGLRAYLKALGTHVNVLRQSQRWTEVQLAKKLGISKSEVIACEAGTAEMPLLTAARLAKNFKISVDELIGTLSPSNYEATHLARRIIKLSTMHKEFILRILDMCEENEVEAGAPRRYRKARIKTRRK